MDIFGTSQRCPHFRGEHWDFTKCPEYGGFCITLRVPLFFCTLYLCMCKWVEFEGTVGAWLIHLITLLLLVSDVLFNGSNTSSVVFPDPDDTIFTGRRVFSVALGNTDQGAAFLDNREIFFTVIDDDGMYVGCIKMAEKYVKFGSVGFGNNLDITDNHSSVISSWYSEIRWCKVAIVLAYTIKSLRGVALQQLSIRIPTYEFLVQFC